MPTDTQQIRLYAAVAKAEQSYASAVALAARTHTATPVRHKCFISYHGADIDAVTEFVERYADVFIPRVIGASDSDHFTDPVNSKDEEYIKDQIGSKYLSDSTVTILFMGKCTWARKYVDWELSSTLKDGAVNKRSGLMAITQADKVSHPLPDRFSDNHKGNEKYARYYYYPTSDSQLRGWIEDAFQARNTRSSLIDNSRSLRKYNSSCP